MRDEGKLYPIDSAPQSDQEIGAYIKARYLSALRAVEAGVKFMQEHEGSDPWQGLEKAINLGWDYRDRAMTRIIFEHLSELDTLIYRNIHSDAGLIRALDNLRAEKQ